MTAVEAELSDLIDQIKSGHFSLSDIVLQCQGLESVGNLLAAANLYNLFHPRYKFFLLCFQTYNFHNNMDRAFYPYDDFHSSDEWRCGFMVIR